MTMEWEKLFDELDIEAYSRKSPGNSTLAVTFDYSAVQGRPPHIPASSFFKSNGCDQFHIVTKGDIWYQTEEFFDVASLILETRSRYDRVITYGNSMGAYGALLISKAIDATDVLAFAPQYSVDSTVLPEELRWFNATSKITFIHHKLETFISASARKTVIFDPFCEEDMRHLRMLRGVENLTEVPIPFSGHFPSTYLHELGCLAKAMEAILFSSNPLIEIISMRRRTRAESSRYFINLSLAYLRRGFLKKALDAASHGYALDPTKPEGLEALLSVAARDPETQAFAHMTITYLQSIRPSFTHYDGMRAGLLSTLRSKYGLVDNESEEVG